MNKNFITEIKSQPLSILINLRRQGREEDLLNQVGHFWGKSRDRLENKYYTDLYCLSPDMLYLWSSHTALNWFGKQSHNTYQWLHEYHQRSQHVSKSNHTPPCCLFHHQPNSMDSLSDHTIPCISNNSTCTDTHRYQISPG